MAEATTSPPPAGYPDTVEHYDSEPPSEPTGVVDMNAVIREHEQNDGACLYWQNVHALHELAAARAGL